MIQINRNLLFLFFLLIPLSLTFSINSQSNAERVDFLLEQLQKPLDYNSQQEIKGAIMRIWEISKSSQIQEKINSIGHFINLRQYQGAEDLLSEIILEQEDFLDAYYKRAIVHYYQGEISSAQEDLYKTLVLEPRHFDALKVLGFILEKQDKKKEAINIYTKLHKILPYDESILEKIMSLKKTI